MTQKERFDSLTGLKGLAIFVIVLFHTLIIDPKTSNFLLVFIAENGGYLGNYLFFMLSGFLISHNYREKIQTHQIDFKSFLFKRLRKLYPLYIITNIISLLIILPFNGISAFNLKQFLLVLFLQTGGGLENIYPYNYPTWFVCTLLVCYLAYYVLTQFAKSLSQYQSFLVLGILWGYILITRDLNFPFCYNHNGEAFITFFLGCLLTEMHTKVSDKNKVWIFVITAGILAALIFLSRIGGFQQISGDVRIGFAFVICPIILYWALAHPLCVKLLSLKPILFLGNISTSIFFWHAILYDLIIIWMNAISIYMTKLWYLIYLVILIGLAALSYLFIEKKWFLNLKRS